MAIANPPFICWIFPFETAFIEVYSGFLIAMLHMFDNERVKATLCLTPHTPRHASLISLNFSFAFSAEISARFLSGWYCLESQASRKQLHWVRKNDRHNKFGRYFGMMLDLFTIFIRNIRYPEIRNTQIQLLELHFSPRKTGPNGLAVTNSAKGRSSKLLAKPTFGKRLTCGELAANL